MSWNNRSLHATILTVIEPILGGTVTGMKQVARVGRTVVIASLWEGGTTDAVTGVRVQIVTHEGGELDSNVFDFAQYDVLGEEFGGRIQLPYGLGALEMPRAVHASALRNAIGAYVLAFE
ncbi:hypothetical protein ACIRBX_24995 [Kitasatospora sp. NPDC096147]|uniref:hypothetical protein n=1 Tax=Kitasatospora sp. NPDC096147 TaxID=3364093 RepID=UPI003809E77F